MDIMSDKAIAAALGMIEFDSLIDVLIFLFVAAVLRIIYIFAAGAMMRICGLGKFKSWGLTLEALPLDQQKKPATGKTPRKGGP